MISFLASFFYNMKELCYFEFYREIILLSNRVVRTLIYCFMFMFLIAYESRAFYHSEDSQGNILQIKQHVSLWNSLAIPDNSIHFSLKQNKGPMIYPNSGNFVPADLISCNVPLRTGIHHPAIAIESSLANLVYANLRLKKLLEEHEALQKRTREALAGLSVPFFESRLPSLDSTIPEFSIHRTQNNLEREQSIITRDADMAGIPNTESLASLRVRLGRSEGEPLYIATGPRSRRSEQRTLYLSGEPLGERRDRGPNTVATPPESNMEAEEPERPNISDRVRMGGAYDKTLSLPWIIRIPINLVTYLFSHPFEAVFYILILFSIVAAIRSGRKKG